MYNVFKRPMFKRGGPTKGTGIMSHVEPRVKQQFGTGAEGLISEGMRNQLAREAARRAALQASISSGVGPTLMTAGTAASTAIPFLLPTGIMASYLYSPEATKADDIIGMYGEAAPEEMITEASQYLGAPARRAARIQSLRSDFDEIRRRKQQAADIAARRAVEKNELGEKDLGEKIELGEKDSKYVESDLRTRVQKEADVIKDLTRDVGLDKAEAALLISTALKTPGSLSDKIDEAVKGAKGIAQRKRQADREAKLLGYKITKEEDIAKIKAGELPAAGKIAQRISVLEAKDKLTNQEKSELANLKTFIDKETYQQKALISFAGKTYDPQRLSQLSRNIEELEKSKDLSQEDKIRLEDLKKEYANQLYYRSILGANFKDGGRVNYAEGTEDPMQTNLETNEMSGQSNEFPTKTVEKLSFAQLRDRLPKEITNDIVQLIANSEEALQDFAYIRTQQDINDFNIKYGVNLILPPAKG